MANDAVRPAPPSAPGMARTGFGRTAESRDHGSQHSSLGFQTQMPPRPSPLTNLSVGAPLPLTADKENDAPILERRSISPEQTRHNGLTAGSLIRHAPQLESPTETQIVIKLPPPRSQRLPYSTSRTGLIYDPRMRFHVDPSPEVGDDAHPEQPRRILSIFTKLVDAGLASEMDEYVYKEHMMFRLPIRAATKTEISWIHDAAYVEDMESLRGAELGELKERTEKGESIYFNNNSWHCATLAAGGAIVATEAVVRQQVKNAVAIIRPPGHHAEHAQATGFCFFNNVCIAARAAQRYHPDKCRKILILDWDVHHGNGVQRAFYQDPNVLYISLHVYRNAKFYPFDTFADHLHCGEGAGSGMTVNIPWEAAGMTDADYIMAFQQVVMPIAMEFDPDLVLISAGFDAAHGDPLGECHVTPAGYAHMTHMLMQLAQGKVVACLEGGYNLHSIAVSALGMTKTLMGEPPERIRDLTPTPSAVNTVQKVIRTQARFWKVLYPKDLNLQKKKEVGAERLHDIIREWQSKVLFEQHQMTELYILRDRLSKSFRNQVLATSNYHEKRPLLIVFHDPPDAEGYPDPRTSKLELHNTFLTDVAKQYVDWACKQDFAVIDVNIPWHITKELDDQGYSEADSESTRAQTTRELAFYLWDNYVDLSDRSHIFLMGVGDAYSGIIDLLSKHPQAAEEVDLTISFVAEHMLRSVVDRELSEVDVISLYYARSLVFVSPHHLCWDPSRTKRLKRRFGHVKKSDQADLQFMLKSHFPEVTTRLLEETEEWRQSQTTMHDSSASSSPLPPLVGGEDADGDTAMDLAESEEDDGAEADDEGAGGDAREEGRGELVAELERVAERDSHGTGASRRA